MNIEGIEILNKIEIVETVFPNWIGWIVLIGSLFFVFGGLLLAIMDDNSWFALGIVIALIFDLLMVMIGDTCKKEIYTGHYRYEVTVSDDVNFKEIHTKYELVETRGEIFVFEDKE